MKKPFFNIVILIFVITSFVNGSIPKIISYQGVVTDSKRNPKQDGKYDFIFTIYNDSVSGDSIWSEKKEIETKQGLFSTELGSVESLALPFDKTYWLGISVEGKAFTKRTKLTCAPYSFRADTADVAKKADTAEIAKGLVDSFYTRDQLKTSGKAKVHAGNIENAPWLDSNPFDQNLNTKNNVKFRFINSNNSSGISIDSVTADNDGSSTSNWNVVSQIKLTSYNNTMAFFTGYPQNQRKSFIQVGHRDSRYGGCTGELRLNPFGGSVTINGYSPWHSGNLDTSKFSLKTDFNPDYFVQGENSFRRCNFDSSTQLDSNIFSTFLRLDANDPSSPDNAINYGIRSAHSSTHTIEIIGRANSGNLYFGGLDGGIRKPWQTIWHSGNLTPPESQSSDIRFKTDIDSIKDALKKVNSLKGISFNWKHSDFPDRHFPEGRQIGVIAQEVEKILPEVIRTDKDGYKSVAYDKLGAILIEAFKEQQSIIDSLKQNLDITKKELEKNNSELINFKNRLSKIEQLMHSKNGD